MISDETIHDVSMVSNRAYRREHYMKTFLTIGIPSIISETRLTPEERVEKIRAYAANLLVE